MLTFFCGRSSYPSFLCQPLGGITLYKTFALNQLIVSISLSTTIVTYVHVFLKWLQPFYINTFTKLNSVKTTSLRDIRLVVEKGYFTEAISLESYVVGLESPTYYQIQCYFKGFKFSILLIYLSLYLLYDCILYTSLEELIFIELLISVRNAITLWLSRIFKVTPFGCP